MTTPEQVKQALELALSLVKDLGDMTPQTAKELKAIAKNFENVVSHMESYYSAFPPCDIEIKKTTK